MSEVVMGRAERVIDGGIAIAGNNMRADLGELDSACVTTTHQRTSAEHIADCADGLFVCGRQHSGNTMVTALLGQFEDVVAMSMSEEFFLEYRTKLDRLPDSVARAEWVSRHLFLQQPLVEEQVSSALKTWAAEHSSAGALDVFQKAGALIVAALGKGMWARKATSYIFHAKKILEEMPNVRLLYCLRNPFDLCASKKRRDAKGEHVVGLALSWKRGLELALACEQRYPGRVHVVCYEELVAEPERIVRALCEFLGKPYSDALLEVPRVNTSDQPYQVVEGAKGMDTSRVHLYMERLTPAEIVATQMLCPRSLVRRFYPDLPHLTKRYSWITHLKAIALILAGVVRYPPAAFKHARRNKFRTVEYMLRRIKALVGAGA